MGPPQNPTLFRGFFLWYITCVPFVRWPKACIFWWVFVGAPGVVYYIPWTSPISVQRTSVFPIVTWFFSPKWFGHFSPRRFGHLKTPFFKGRLRKNLAVFFFNAQLVFVFSGDFLLSTMVSIYIYIFTLNHWTTIWGIVLWSFPTTEQSQI